MSCSDSLFGLLALFTIFVVPLWLVFHYITRWVSQRKAGKSLAGEDLQRLQELRQTAGHLQSRIETLEQILDARAPDWRRPP